MKLTTTILLAICINSLIPLAAQSKNPLFSNAGLRVGIDAENEINLVSYELFGTFDMDWSWQLSQHIRLDLDIETALGGLSGESKTAAYGRIAPVAEFHFGDFPISLTFSSGPSLYSEDTFDKYDIGGTFQFTSSLGFDWALNKDWSLGYRFQHTSNADLEYPNPGLDMHTFHIAHTF